jgi:hypothetical protein
MMKKPAGPVLIKRSTEYALIANYSIPASGLIVCSKVYHAPNRSPQTLSPPERLTGPPDTLVFIPDPFAMMQMSESHSRCLNEVSSIDAKRASIGAERHLVPQSLITP